MAVNDFVRRSMQIVAGGIKESTTDYFDNVTSFVTDVKEVVDMGKQMGSDGTKKFNELKSSGILKKTRDWFYNEAGIFGDFDFDDDEFDPGFDLDDTKSSDKKQDEGPLSKDKMSDIMKKQTGAMYKAFGRQADLHIANTAEIVSTINTRSAELTASVNNINNTLIQIGKRLDLIVEWTSSRAKKEEEAKRNASILDYGGGISFSGVVNKAKQSAEDSMLGTFMSIGKTMLGSGMVTPETVMSLILSQTILDKKWDKLGGKSVNDIGNFINDTVGEVIQNTMTKILTSKNDMLESLFEDIIHRAGNRNYQSAVVNTYNTKPAVFDGMTRKSIITIIPNYLNEILKAVSKDKTGFEVSDKGTLTKRKANSFVQEVANQYYRPGMMEWKERERAHDQLKGFGLSMDDVRNAVQTLTMSWLWYMYRTGRVILEKGEVKNILASSTREVIDNASELMSSKTKYSADEWKKYYLVIVDQIDEFKFRQEIQRNAERSDQAFETFAKTHVNANQASTINSNVLSQAFDYGWSQYNSTSTQTSSTNNDKNKGGVGSSQIGSMKKSVIPSELDYMRGIFDRLNRGINVYVTGTSDPKDSRKKKYDKLNMFPGYATRGISVDVDTDSNSGIVDAVHNIGDKLKANIIGDKKIENAPDEIKEIYRQQEAGQPLTATQEKKLKKYESEQVKGKAKGFLKNALGIGDNRNSIVANPEAINFIDDIFNDVKQKVSDFMPEGMKNFFGGLKDKLPGKAREKVDKVGEINGEKVVNKIADNKVANALFGELSYDENGQGIRNGGFINKAANSISNFGTNIGNKFTSKETLMERTKELMSKYDDSHHFQDTEKDQLLMQSISSKVNIAMANGSIESLDEQSIREDMNKIQDPEIRKQLNKSLVPLMKKNAKEQSKAKAGTDDENLTTGLKAKTLLFGLGKMIFRPITTYVKLIIGSVIAIIKNGIGAITKVIKMGVKSGLTDIKSGVKSIGSGMKYIGKAFGVYGSRIINQTYKIANGVNKGLSKLGKFASRIFGGVKEIFTNLKDYAKQEIQNRKEEKERQKAQENQESGNEIKQNKEKKEKSALGQWLSDKKDAFAKSSFGSGFLEAWSGRKEAQAKAKLKEEAKPVTQGIDDSELSKDIKDVIESENGKTGFFRNLLDTVKGIFNKMPENEKSLKNENTNNSASVAENVSNAVTKSATAKTATATTAATGIKGLLGKGLGLIVGGLSSAVIGIFKMMVSIVAGMEGLQAITKMVQTILTESLAPLNDAFKSIFKVLKPLMKQIGGIIKQLSQFIVQVVDVLVGVIKPVMESIIKPVLGVVSPLLETIIDLINPILTYVGDAMNLILKPTLAIFKVFIMPRLKLISDAVMTISGVVQMGFGFVMKGIGGIISGIGSVVSAISGVIASLFGSDSDLGEDIVDIGESMIDRGDDLITSGKDTFVQGVTNFAADVEDMLTLKGLTSDDTEITRKKETKKIEPTSTNVVQNTYASGDTYTNGDTYNIYGGEFQRGMGGYLNMNQRGCGPIALADMYNRSGGALSARSLAGSMYGSGTYDPHRGTSVGGYISAAHSLGMNLTPGRVTQQSLKFASPTNPITVVGSGSDFGTRNGNNHFMNVIGTDRHGGAYISNPLTGRIDRKPASTIAGTSVVGLFAGGDEPDGGYSFPDAIKEAFVNLKNQAAKILGLFSMEKSNEEDLEDIISTEQNKSATEQARRQLGEEEYLKVEKAARENARQKFMELYPMKDGETREEYSKRFETYWEKNSTKYLAEAKLYDAASENNRNAMATLAASSDDLVDAYVGNDSLIKNLGMAYKSVGENVKSIISSKSSSGSGSGGSGYFTSDDGVALWTPYSDNIQITDTDITQSNYHSPLFEFFSKTMGDQLGSVYGSGWYSHYNNPNKEGVGSAGGSHSGVDFTGPGILGKPLYATTGGEVIANWTPDQSGGGGNTIIWKDSAGKYHWYMHMNEQSKLKVGDIIEGGDLIGYVGNTGHSTGPHLHYTINDTIASSGGGNVVNPLMYFKNYNPSGGYSLVGNTDQEKIYSYMISHGFLPHAAAAAMGCFQVESANDPNTIEGYYAFDAQTVKKAMQNYDTLNDYTVNKLFPYYVTQSHGIDRSAYQGSDGRYYAGIGLAQWTGPRTRALADYTVEKGLTWNNLGGQLDYLSSEIKNVSRYNSALTQMNNSNNVNEATSIWLSAFEGQPGNKLSERQAFANQFYERYKNFSPTSNMYSPTGQGSMSTGFGIANSAADGRRVDNYRQIKSYDGKNTGTVSTNGDALNMRSGTSIDSSILLQIPNGTHLNLEASGTDGWYKTTFGGKTGYVSAAYVILDNDAANDHDYTGTKTSVTPTGGSYLIESYTDKLGKLLETSVTTKPTSTSWYDFGSWFTLNDDATERTRKKGYYKDAANYHLKAQQGIGKNGKKATGSEKNIIDNYIDTYGANVVTRGNSTWFGDEWEYYADAWSNVYDSTKNKSNVNYSTYPISKQLQALGKIYGSGDNSDLEFWNNYMNWNNNYATTPIPENNAYYQSYTADDNAGTTVFNHYSITRAENTDADRRLKAILEHTYNVRSESMESIMIEILNELKKKKDSNGGNVDTNGSVKLFDEKIPSQVTNLSIG